MSEKLSEAQWRTLRKMKKQPNMHWWTLLELDCRRNVADALERKGFIRVFYDSINGDHFSLTPGAERVPIPDDKSIPF